MRRPLHVLEWLARSISFAGLAMIAAHDILFGEAALVVPTTIIVLVALGYSALAFRLRLGQLEPAGPQPAWSGPRQGHPYRDAADPIDSSDGSHRSIRDSR
jgi:hypothetical protein